MFKSKDKVITKADAYEYYPGRNNEGTLMRKHESMVNTWVIEWKTRPTEEWFVEQKWLDLIESRDWDEETN